MTVTAGILALVTVAAAFSVLVPVWPLRNRRMAVLAFFLAFGALIIVTNEFKDVVFPGMVTETAAEASANPCPDGAQRSGRNVFVTGKAVNMRTGPGTEFERVPAPEKAQTFLTLDAPVAIFEECRAGDWSRVLVSPNGKAAVRGWVATQFLSKDQPASYAAQTRPQSIEDYDDRQRQRWIAIGMLAVKERLRDPGSAEFKDVYFMVGRKKVPVTCGRVNSKNGFGAYGGFERFLSAGQTELTYLESEVADFQYVWNEFCVRPR